MNERLVRKQAQQLCSQHLSCARRVTQLANLSRPSTDAHCFSFKASAAYGKHWSFFSFKSLNFKKIPCQIFYTCPLRFAYQFFFQFQSGKWHNTETLQKCCFCSLKIKSWAQEPPMNVHQILPNGNINTQVKLYLCVCMSERGRMRSTQWEYWVNKYLLRITQLWYRRGFMAWCIWTLLIFYEIIVPRTTPNTAWLKDLPFKFKNMKRTGIKSVMPLCSTQWRENINKQATRTGQ